jgi:predicted transcriptional regulator of viral defense system
LHMSQQGISGSGRTELALVAGRRRFITPADVSAELEVEPRVATRKLAGWAGRGWLRRVRRGLYIPVPVGAERPNAWLEDPLAVADAVWGPCYFTGWTVAGRWGLTEQVFRTVVLKTTQRVRVSEERLLDYDYLLAHASPTLLEWGLESAWQEDVRLQLADPARVVVDVMDSPRLGGGIRLCAEFLGAYLEDRDPAVLVGYGDRLGNGAVFKRLGYLLETLGLGDHALLEACRARVRAGIVLLDPSAGGGGPRIARWGLRANVAVTREDPS